MWKGRLVAGLLVVALLAGCTGGSAPEAPASSGVPSSVPVAADAPAVAADGGVTVRVPAGAVSGSGALTVTQADVGELEDVPDGVEPLDSVSVDLAGAELVDPATVEFPFPDGSGSSDDPLVVMWQDGKGGWRLLPSEQQDGKLVAQTNHFSFGFTARIDVNEWVKDRKEGFVDYISSRSGVDQPSCGDEQLARAAGVTVKSDGGDAVKWCYGVENGETVLKIANNRRSFATVSFPDRWKVKNGSSVSFSPDAAARLLGSAATEFVHSGKDVDARTIDGGDTLTLIVGKDGEGTATVEGDFTAWAFSGVVFGIDVFTGVASALGVYPKDNDTFTRLAKVINGEKGDGYFKAFLSCTRAQMDQFGDASSNADDSAASGSALKFMWSCVPSLMQADMAATGVKMFARGLVLQAVGLVVGTVLTGLHLLLTAGREIWDSFASFGGKSDSSYDIRVRQDRSASSQPSAEPGASVPEGITIWYPGAATTFVPGMWALEKHGSKFLFASNTEGLHCMGGSFNGSEITYRYFDQDFDFPGTTGTGSGRLTMSGPNLVLHISHGAAVGGEAIPGSEADKPWVTAEFGRESLAQCAEELQP